MILMKYSRHYSHLAHKYTEWCFCLSDQWPVSFTSLMFRSQTLNEYTDLQSCAPSASPPITFILPSPLRSLICIRICTSYWNSFKFTFVLFFRPGTSSVFLAASLFLYSVPSPTTPPPRHSPPTQHTISCIKKQTTDRSWDQRIWWVNESNNHKEAMVCKIIEIKTD